MPGTEAFWLLWPLLVAGPLALGWAIHAFYANERRERAKRRALAAVAARLELTALGDAVVGVREGHRIEIRVADHHEHPQGKPRPEILVGAPDGGSFDAWLLELPWEHDPDADEVLDGEHGHRSGDDRFDRLFRLGSLEAGALAPLDAATRDLLVEVRKRRESFRLAEGRLLLLLPPGTLAPGQLVAGVEAAIAFARRLAAVAANVPGALARNARGDRSPGVRLRNLEELASHFPALPLTHETLRALCADPEPDVRLLAAIFIGREGLATLAEAVRAAWVDGGLRERALLHLVKEFPLEEARPLVAAFLDDGPDALRRDALLAIWEAGGPEWEHLALGGLALEFFEVRHAAIRALGRIGSKESVPALRAIVRDEPHDVLQNAATVALAQIRERLGSATAGQVALADDGGAGRLSVAGEDGAGNVSLTPPPGERGRVALPGGSEG